jgi:hypothetical protein
MRPKPAYSQFRYQGGDQGFGEFHRAEQVWCAEAMQDAAERIEKAVAAMPPPPEPARLSECERFGHNWEYFYISQGQPVFCKRCGLTAGR